jgi:hypothetical protein
VTPASAAADPSADSGRGSRLLEEWFGALVEHHHTMAGQAEEHVADLAVANVAIRLRFTGAGMRAALLPALAHHRPAAARDAPATEPFTILISDAPTGSPPIPHFPFRPEDIGPKGEVAAATAGSIRTAWFAGSRLLSVIDLERRTAVCWTPDAAALPWYEHAAPLRTLFHWILAANGRNLVHAAAVASPSGAGALLAGRGGSGKSTTAMLCIAAGLDYAGDDYVGLSGGDDSWAAHSLYGSAKLSRATLGWLPFLRSGLRVDAAGEGKAVVMLGDVMPDRLARSFPIAALIVPQVGTSPRSSMRRTSSAMALRALAPTTIFQLPGSGPEIFERLASFTRSVPAWSLDLGRDREAIPTLVARAIEESC